VSERLTAQEAELAKIESKRAEGYLMDYREWRIWLRHNWRSLHFDLPTIQARRLRYGEPKNGYRQNMGPMSGGIYFLFLDDELQYVGKATLIARRLWRHFLERPYWDHASWIEAPAECAEEVEHYYIRAFDPPQNLRRLSCGDLMESLVKANANTPDLHPGR